MKNVPTFGRKIGTDFDQTSLLRALFGKVATGRRTVEQNAESLFGLLDHMIRKRLKTSRFERKIDFRC